MVETAVFTYGMLASFVLSGVSRNQKLARPNPRMLEGVAWVLLGSLIATSALLLLSALTGRELPIG